MSRTVCGIDVCSVGVLKVVNLDPADYSEHRLDLPCNSKRAQFSIGMAVARIIDS